MEFLRNLVKQIKALFAPRLPSSVSSKGNTNQAFSVRNADDGRTPVDWIACAWGEDVPNDLARAVASCRTAAEAGDADAQYRLGVLYLTGQGVFPDFAQSDTWIRKSAEQGNARAQFHLATLYCTGSDELAQDYGQAAAWYRKAADLGYAPAQADLGRLYAIGQGVTQDYAQALAWYRKSADQGDSTAQYTLGMFHDSGLAGTQDLVVAAGIQNSAVRAYGVEEDMRCPCTCDALFALPPVQQTSW